MKLFFRLLKGDFQKIRHTSIFWIHVAIPIIGVILFLSYYSFSGWSTEAKVSGYLQALSRAFPLLIGIISAMIVDQEALAGHFQVLLMAKTKYLSFLSKLCMLLLMGFGSIILAVGGFAFGLEFLLHENSFSITFYCNMILILFFSEIFLYILHIICSFRFGTGASIGLGIAETLISTIMLTQLGDKDWKWIPCGWSGRFCDYYLECKTSVGDISDFIIQFKSGAIICFAMTLILLVGSILWFHYFEGRNED